MTEAKPAPTFTGQQVFEMTWAALEAINTMQALYGSHHIVMPSVTADAVRGLLELNQSPVGLRCTPGATAHAISWYSSPAVPPIIREAP